MRRGEEEESFERLGRLLILLACSRVDVLDRIAIASHRIAGGDQPSMDFLDC